jgi:predicted RNA binding protein YcfA (HicA-like mRNA interferase family)
MPKLPVVSGKETIKKLEKAGYAIMRQKGSHVRLRSDQLDAMPITVPLHNEIKQGLLLQILKDAGLTIEQFNKL